MDTKEVKRTYTEIEYFLAQNLTPGVNYTFRVAAVNDFGEGPFTDLLRISTNEARMS